MQNKKFLYSALGVALLIVAVALIVVERKNQALPEVKYSRADAPASKVISGFPKQLVASAKNLDESYQLSYPNGTQLQTTKYTTTLSVQAVHDQLVKSLKDSKYIVDDPGISKDASGNSSSGFRALNIAGKSVNAFIYTLDKQTVVMISVTTGGK